MSPEWVCWSAPHSGRHLLFRVIHRLGGPMVLGGGQASWLPSLSRNWDISSNGVKIEDGQKCNRCHVQENIIKIKVFKIKDAAFDEDQNATRVLSHRPPPPSMSRRRGPGPMPVPDANATQGPPPPPRSAHTTQNPPHWVHHPFSIPIPLPEKRKEKLEK
ncbi:unnamed protein product [Pleuronectes platessa]|uniref:Uncharacterized protein n=1 Tax=Pleuronectes platessa TaxID=8262 RepID=A0A9N7VR93_PLEPL|nr:unnamed protein product [Pleuronectes platessa]